MVEKKVGWKKEVATITYGQEDPPTKIKSDQEFSKRAKIIDQTIASIQMEGRRYGMTEEQIKTQQQYTLRHMIETGRFQQVKSDESKITKTPSSTPILKNRNKEILR